MTSTLFEVSWEVCNKVGGIYTVVSSKARTATDQFGAHYVAVGPFGVETQSGAAAFEEEQAPELQRFTETCAARGLRVRVGRWRIAGRPRTVLVEFSSQFDQKDQILSAMWERFSVDSLHGGWDYVEPVVFGHAAALAIQVWHESFVVPEGGRSLAHFHEWMTGAGLLHLRHASPEIGTVFTTHATVLGRALSATGLPPDRALAGRTPDQASTDLGLRAKHSLEAAATLAADVFTTVSSLTATEAELLLGRRPAPVTPNGIDPQWIAELAGRAPRAALRERLSTIASQLCGRDLSGALHLCLSGRYEFGNKGIDALLGAARLLDGRPGAPLVIWILVPAGNSGPRREVRQRVNAPLPLPSEPLGIAVHELIEPERDPVQEWCRQVGWASRSAPRVQLVQVPAYLHGADGLFDAPYEAVLAAMDLSVFPSFYEPWGYTPVESLAVGVPTISTDCAGFGLWAKSERLGPEHGVTVLERRGKDLETFVAALSAAIEEALASPRERGALSAACQATAARLDWTRLWAFYQEAYAEAERRATLRAPLPKRRRPILPVHAVPVAADRFPHLAPFDVSSSLPPELADLEVLSRNFWWSWDPEGQTLFQEVSPRMWRECEQNPVTFLRRVYPADLERVAADPEYRAKLERVSTRFHAYLEDWTRELDLGDGALLSPQHPVAYFCFEFGLHSSLRIYSGGLGILAGDHLKSASDLGLPLVAVGLFYAKGYVRQSLSPSGEQLSLDVRNDPRDLPLELVRRPDGEELRVEVNLAGDRVFLRAWRVDVGRVPLYLLDADCPENRVEARAVTERLYGGHSEDRVRQEIVLGRGGVRLLQELGLDPAVLHLNEGHAAFAALERVGRLVREEDLTFAEAAEVVRGTTVFTTHTPVPAGHDVFSEDLMRRYFADVERWIGRTWEGLLELGSDAQGQGGFNMTYLAASLAGWVNGVAEKHGEVSRALLHPFWSSLIETEVPVTHVTNGVHLPTWVRPGIAALLGAGQRAVRPQDFAAAALALDDGALWSERRRAKAELLAEVRHSLATKFTARSDSPKLLARLLDRLPDDGLVIGFARRFAPYKRATLLFQDLERLQRLLSNPARPVLFLFSGKAHPADAAGKELVRKVVELSRKEPLLGRVVFLEDYDMELARVLVQGVDVWLNNPIRPLEASGTSGMKVAANGGLNLSVLDGWWIEACDGRNGWAIGGGRVFDDQALQDQLDNEHLLQLLEEQVVPLFFERDARGLPRGWLDRVRHDLHTIPEVFNTDRMVSEYRDRAYVPLARFRTRLCADGFSGARSLAAEHRRLTKGFDELRIQGVRIGALDKLRTGDPLDAEVDLSLGSLQPADVVVELVVGYRAGERDLRTPRIVELEPLGPPKDGVLHLRGAHFLESSGRWAYGVRVRPRPRFGLDVALRGKAIWA
jgi:phosphorylase/glycogen(starch) synthase